MKIWRRFTFTRGHENTENSRANLRIVKVLETHIKGFKPWIVESNILTISQPLQNRFCCTVLPKNSSTLRATCYSSAWFEGMKLCPFLASIKFIPLNFKEQGLRPGRVNKLSGEAVLCASSLHLQKTKLCCTRCCVMIIILPPLFLTSPSSSLTLKIH